MSIVIAKIENNKCLFKSDTKVSINNGDKTVTGDNQLRLPPCDGILKIHILHQSICIAFAGTVEVCSQIIHDLCKIQPHCIDDILSHLQNGLIKENDNSEFIVGTYLSSNKLRLFRVDNQTIEEGTSFWIGVKEAFNEFQSYFLQKNTKDSELDWFSHCFGKMINNSEISTIGDFTIGVYFRKQNKSFVYEEYLESRSGYETIKAKANIETLLSEGTVYEGAFTTSCLISNRTDIPAVCLYFSKGLLGYFYLPISKVNNKVNPIVIANVDIQSLKQIITKEYGIELYGYSYENGHLKVIQ